MYSLKKVCDDNISLQETFNISTEIKESLQTEKDRLDLYHQLSSMDVVPLNHIIQ